MDTSNNSIAILGAAIGAGGSMFLSFLRTLPMSDKNPSARPDTTTMQRGTLSFPEDRLGRDDGVSFVSGDYGLTISVGEEQAMDSYNRQFECSVTLDRSDAEAVYAWLGKVLGK